MKIKKLRVVFYVLAVVVFSLGGAVRLFAEEFQCEVLNLKGKVTVTDPESGTREVKQGDLLRAGQTLDVGEDGYADLAYDKDWRNITRLEANSKIKIASIVPGKLGLEQGGVFAKLKKLPEGSSFEVKTPTAVATVRGSEYRTTFSGGQTDVFNASMSKIYVAGVKADGSVDRDSTVTLQEAKKTSVASAGKAPAPPADMTPAEKKAGQTFSRAIQKNIDSAVTEKRESRIQSVTQIEEFIREAKRNQAASSAQAEEYSRVTDQRRRAFAGGEREMAPPEKEEPSTAPPAASEVPKEEKPASEKNG